MQSEAGQRLTLPGIKIRFGRIRHSLCRILIGHAYARNNALIRETLLAKNPSRFRDDVTTSAPTPIPDAELETFYARNDGVSPNE